MRVHALVLLLAIGPLSTGSAATDGMAQLDLALNALTESKIEEVEARSLELGDSERAWVLSYAEERMRHPETALDGSAIDRELALALEGSSPEQRAAARAVLSLILMGDITGALREYARNSDRDMRRFTRSIVNQLEKVRNARARVIRNFARTAPPRSYAGSDPNSAARAQDRGQRYTQFVQLSAQLMSEMQNTERELVDALQTTNRDLDNFWQSYASFRDEAFRTNERVMTTR